MLGAADALVESPAVKLLGLGCWSGSGGSLSCWRRARCCGRHCGDEINAQSPEFRRPPEMAKEEDGGSHAGSAASNTRAGRVRLQYLGRGSEDGQENS